MQLLLWTQIGFIYDYNKNVDIFRLTDEGWIKTRVIRLESFLPIGYYNVDI